MPLIKKHQKSIQLLAKQLKDFRKQYLIKKFENLDESATRIMINNFLTDILGYRQLEDIKTEFSIKGTYADYVVQVDRKKHFVVEVKSMQIDLAEQHLRQATGYAANEGIDWILLTNGRQFNLFRIIFGKPISTKNIFSIDLKTMSDYSKAAENLFLLSRKAFTSRELEKYWTRFKNLEPIVLSKYLYEKEVINFLKRVLRNKTSITFSDEDIIDSIYNVILEKIPTNRPKNNSAKKKIAGSNKVIVEKS